jgi:metal-responsive CopG/Arc/MetJ family transcriptional regulator
MYMSPEPSMSRMHRTQIHLEPDLNDALERIAAREGTTKARLIREAARRLVGDDRRSIEEDPIWGIMGMFSSGLTDVSTNHDKYLATVIKGGRVVKWEGEPRI